MPKIYLICYRRESEDFGSYVLVYANNEKEAVEKFNKKMGKFCYICDVAEPIF